MYDMSEFEILLGPVVFPSGRKINRHCRVECSLCRALITTVHPIIKNEYLVFALVDEVQAVVDSIVWAFRMVKKPRTWEMNARGFTLHSVYPQLSFSFSLINTPFLCSLFIKKPQHFFFMRAEK